MATTTRAIGSALNRIEGRAKVTAEATYAYEYQRDRATYAAIVQSAIAKGEIRGFDAAAALAVPGVLAVLWAANAPRLVDAEGELAVLQSRRVSYRGQIVAAVVAESLEASSEGAALIRVEYAEEEPDLALRADHPGLYKPHKVNPSFET